MRPPRDKEALEAMAKELAALYAQTNGFDPERGTFDQMIVAVVEHAVTYAFRIGYETRVGEEQAGEPLLS